MGAPYARNFWIKTAVRLAFTAALLWIVWQMVEGDWDDVITTLRGISLPLLTLTFLNELLGRFIMACQTRLSMQVHGARYSKLVMFAINLKTMFFAFFLPGDLSGAGVKWYLISRLEGKRAETLAAMVYVRMVSLSVVLLTGLSAMLIDWPFEDRSALLYLLLSLALVLSAILALHLQLTQAWWDSLLASPCAARLGSGVLGRLNKLHDAFLAVSIYNWRDILTLWGFSFTVKLSATVSFWLGARALGIDLGFVALLWIHSAVEIVQFLPISIAGLGSRDIAVIYMLGLFDVPEGTALGFSLLLFALRLAMVALGGLLAGWNFVRGETSWSNGSGAR